MRRFPRDFASDWTRPGLFQPPAQLPASRDTAPLQEEGASAEDCEIGDRPNLIADGQIRMRVYIHFEDKCATGHVLRQRLNFRRRQPARTAPCSPKIHQNWDFRTLNDGLQDGAVSLDGFSSRT